MRYPQCSNICREPVHLMFHICVNFTYRSAIHNLCRFPCKPVHLMCHLGINFIYSFFCILMIFESWILKKLLKMELLLRFRPFPTRPILGVFYKCNNISTSSFPYFHCLLLQSPIGPVDFLQFSVEIEDATFLRDEKPSENLENAEMNLN